MSSRISFRVLPHSGRSGVGIVEILLDGQVCAFIHPDEEKEQSIKVVSAHFVGELTHDNKFPDGIKMDTGESTFPPIPSIHISFDPRNYEVNFDTIIRAK